MKVVFVYKNHFNYLKCVFERLYDYLLNFCASKYHLYYPVFDLLKGI